MATTVATNISSITFRPTRSNVSYEDPNWKTEMWFIMFLVVTILGILLNVAITWIVWAHRSMKTITNVLIGNIGIAGLLLALSAIPILYPYKKYSFYWQIPGACAVHEFVTTFGLCIFVFSLMVMSIERYYAIKYPGDDLSIIRSGTTLKIWFCSFIISIPNWIFSGIDKNAVLSTELAWFCSKDWPYYLGGDNLRRIYSFVLLFVTYFIPVGVMIYRSVQLGVELFSHRSADLTEVNKESQKQTVKMMIVQVIVFAILWLPFCVYSLIFEKHVHDIDTAFHWLAMTSIVFYPVIYIWMENRFQKKLKKVFRWCPCIDYESKSLNYALERKPSIIIAETYRPISDV